MNETNKIWWKQTRKSVYITNLYIKEKLFPTIAKQIIDRCLKTIAENGERNCEKSNNLRHQNNKYERKMPGHPIKNLKHLWKG